MLERIVQECAKEFGVTVEAIMSTDRHCPIPDARHLAYLLVREKMGVGCTKIGRMFRRDHSSVQHGVKKAGALIKYDPAFASKARAVKDRLGSQETDSVVHVVVKSINQPPRVYQDEATAFSERKAGEMVWTVSARA